MNDATKEALETIESVVDAILNDPVHPLYLAEMIGVLEIVKAKLADRVA